MANPAADALLDRLEPADLDLPDGRARIRLAIRSGGETDVLLDRIGGTLAAPSGRADTDGGCAR